MSLYTLSLKRQLKEGALSQIKTLKKMETFDKILGVSNMIATTPSNSKSWTIGDLEVPSQFVGTEKINFLLPIIFGRTLSIDFSWSKNRICSALLNWVEYKRAIHPSPVPIKLYFHVHLAWEWLIPQIWVFSNSRMLNHLKILLRMQKFTLGFKQIFDLVSSIIGLSSK
jgi:hypothetical protein